jgi:hypothetical protein
LISKKEQNSYIINVNSDSNFEKTYKYHHPYKIAGDGTGIRGSAPHLRGTKAMGWGCMADGNCREPVCLEVLSVGPIFRELDYRWLEREIRTPPFQKQAPLLSLHG